MQVCDSYVTNLRSVRSMQSCFNRARLGSTVHCFRTILNVEMNSHHSDSLLASVPPRSCRFLVYILAFFLLSGHDMDTTLLWKDPEGSQTIKIVVAKRIKARKDGLHPFQEQHIVYILNGEDVSLCTMTGNGNQFSSPFLFFAILKSASTLSLGLVVELWESGVFWSIFCAVLVVLG